MKKAFLKQSALAAICLLGAVFTSCNESEALPDETLTSNQRNAGVVINSITWATCNVDAPGTFAANPEDAGKFYRWNTKTVWSETEGTLKTMFSRISWESANDPSPAGWRVPTCNELQALFDTAKVSREWTAQNAVHGCKFTDKATGNTLFFPAAGYCAHGTGYSAGVAGYYWSSNGIDTGVYHMFFNSTKATDYSTEGFNEYLSIRSVAE